ncbi:hypothetical protein A7982_13691 [Minicystis rosea]|nr:hypothetical protein A7982_13691 [Minicystis rosea]
MLVTEVGIAPTLPSEFIVVRLVSGEAQTAAPGAEPTFT